MAVENRPPTALDQLLELDRRLFNLERRTRPAGSAGLIVGTDFVCVNMGSWPFSAPAPELKLGSVAVGPTIAVDNGGCADSRVDNAVTLTATPGIDGFLPVWGTAG